MKNQVMLKEVQKQKMMNTVQMLCKSNFNKEQFMKNYIPIQQELIKKLKHCGNISISVLQKFVTLLRQEKQADSHYIQNKQKSMLNKSGQFKVYEKKQPNQQFSDQQWNRNTLRILQSLSNNHVFQLNSLKNYYKVLDSAYNQIQKEENKYKSDVINSLKEIGNLFIEIDSNQKQQNKIIARITKDSKSKQNKSSIFYLTELKRTEVYFRKEIQAFTKRSNKILEFMKNLVKWEKATCKKMKEILSSWLAKRKQIFRQTAQSQKMNGLLAVLEDNIQDTRQLYFQKSLTDPQLTKKISQLVPTQKSKVHHLIKFLSLSRDFFIEKANPQITFKTLAASLSFKNFQGVSLAQGWIMTTYTPAVAYLTFDHILALFDKEGNLLQSISSQSTKINKVCDNNTLLLEEKTKGFFRDKKQQYQLKFDDNDRMQEFILFIQNQIN